MRLSSSKHRFGARAKSAVPLQIFLAAISVLILVPCIYGHEYPRSVASVFDDVVTYGKLAALVGFMSDLGITLWLSMSVLMAHAYHRRLESGRAVSGEERLFFISSILILLFLAMDDRLLIHEALSGEMGVPKWITLGCYGAVVVSWGVRFRKYLLGEHRGWLWLALAAFVISEVVDLNFLSGVLNPVFSASGQDVIEEGAKWIGICALFLHLFVLTAVIPSKR